MSFDELKEIDDRRIKRRKQRESNAKPNTQTAKQAAVYIFCRTSRAFITYIGDPA
jgi:hypothetical protein